MTYSINYKLNIIKMSFYGYFYTVIFLRLLFFYGYFQEDRKVPIIPFGLLVEGGGDDLKKLVDVVCEGGTVEGVDKFNNSSLICCLRNL